MQIVIWQVQNLAYLNPALKLVRNYFCILLVRTILRNLLLLFNVLL